MCSKTFPIFQDSHLLLKILFFLHIERADIPGVSPTGRFFKRCSKLMVVDKICGHLCNSKTLSLFEHVPLVEPTHQLIHYHKNDNLCSSRSPIHSDIERHQSRIPRLDE